MAEARKEVESDSVVAADNELPWHPVRKLLFRFSCLYFVGYALPDFVVLGPYNVLERGMNQLAAWLAGAVLHLGEIRLDATGSGDMTVHYVKVLTLAALALAGSLLWSVLDRHRPHYRRLGEWLTVACRYYLLSVMLSYGFAKIFTGQFPPPSLTRLVQPFGDASPMGLLWTFMGFSKAYSAFAGLGEIIGGLLLAFRRTTTLGALVIIGVMSNVVILNFSYDVPVKLYSCHLLMLALVLAGLDGRRILDLLVRNRPVSAALHPAHFSSLKLNRAALGLKSLAVTALVVSGVVNGLGAERAYRSLASKPAIYGIYDVERFEIDGETLAPLLTESRRWQTVIFDVQRQLTLRMMDGEMRAFGFGVDGARSLKIFRDRETGFGLTFEKPDPNSLRLAGEFEGSSVVVELKERDLEEFQLLSRGFHWVNEEPFNR